MSNNICGTCSKSASSRDLIRCFGKCRTAFHPNCVDAKMDIWLKTFKECPFAKFMCLDCQHNSLGDASAEISGLNDQIDQVSHSVKLLTDKLETSFEKINNEATKIMKQLNLAPPVTPSHFASTSNANQHNVAAASFVSRRSFIPPTDCIIGSCSVVDESIKAAAYIDKKFVYASKFNISTTSDVLCKFLSLKIGVSEEDFECRILLAANQDVSRLNFVSFKIGVDPALFNKLLQPDIWPSGILVREFVNRPKNQRQF